MIHLSYESTEGIRNQLVGTSRATNQNRWRASTLPARESSILVAPRVRRHRSSRSTGRAVFAEAFRRVPALINGTDPEVTQIDESLAPLRRSVELVEQGQIFRSLLGDRLAHYIVPLAIAGDDDGRASYSPEFNEVISEKAVFWPQVRARWDAERVSLVSTERETGWFHDLWFPGYLWGDTEGLWRVPGLEYRGGMGSYDVENLRLVAAFESLQRQETAPGRWGLGGTQLPFGRELQDRFPLVGRFLDEQGHPAVSQLLPEQATRTFEGVFG